MKTFTPRNHPPFFPPFAPAFSLVEVMMALAIASLGFITMLGLLPQGLQLTRDAAALSAESRITQKLAGELQTTSWENLDWTGYSPVRYFNDQGIEMSKEDLESRGPAAFSLSYIAAVQMPDQPMDFLLPANGTADETEDYLRRVRICVASTSNPDFDFVSAPPRLVRSHTAIVADTDR